MAERKFGTSDGNLLEHADVVSTYLYNDISLFNKFDSLVFDLDLPNIIEQKATEALLKGTDDTNKTQLSTRTLALQNAMDSCKEYLNDMEYWVKKAFPDHLAIQKQFGVGRVSTLFRKQAVLIQFMENLSETIKSHTEALQSVGTPVDMLDKAIPLSKSLRSANKEQEQQKGSRTVDTEARVIRLNELYDILKKIDEASVFIFKEELTKRNLYRIPRQKSTNTDLSTESTEVE
ncbi:hypothetical protein [Aquimarina longa]|uniref:hypothetical protein n=1 Tax=Aquimarina longa TaxID=1080221 RepID=UPI000785C0FB|nr:hypothetical protein [Aquimarina longa]